MGIGQSEYGLYQIIGSLTAYINILESMLTTSILRFYCQAKADANQTEMENVLAIARIVYRVASFVVIIFGAVFAFVFNTMYSATMTSCELHEGLVMLLVVSVNIIVNMTYFTYSIVVQAHERFVFIKLLELACLILQPVVVLLLISSMPQALMISIVQLILSLITCLMKKKYATSQLGCKIVAHDVSLKTIMPIIGFSGIMLVSMIADIVFAKTGQLVSGAVLGTAAVSVYSVGYQVYQAYGVMGRMVSSVFVPHVTEITKKIDYRSELSCLWNKTGRFSAYIVAGILLGFLLFGQEFIAIWVGEGYEESYFVALVMMLAFVPDILQALGLTYLQVLDRYNFRAFVYVACATGNILLSIPLTACMGVAGAAVAGLIVLSIGSGLIMNLYYGRVIGLDVSGFWRSIANALKGVPLAAVIGLCLCFAKCSSPTLTLLLHCCAFVVVYGVCIYCISMSQEEKLFVRKFVSKLID